MKPYLASLPTDSITLDALLYDHTVLLKYLSAMSIHFLGSLMDNSISLAFKSCMFESMIYEISMIFNPFFISIYLFVCSFFLNLGINGYSLEYESGICLCIKYTHKPTSK